MNAVNVRNIVIGKGTSEICVPITGKIREGLLSEVEVLKSVSVDMVGWHMDWFRKMEYCEKAVAMLQVLREAMSEISVLATLCSGKEGGELEISAVACVELNKAIIDSGGTNLIDVELFAGEAQAKELITHAHDKGVYVIISNRNFDKASSYNEVLTHLETTQILGTDILKTTTMPTCKADVITLLQATNDMYENFADRPVITMSMVGTGVLFRLCGEVFGSALTFSAAKKASAPGQMGVGDLKTVFSLLYKDL